MTDSVLTYLKSIFLYDESSPLIFTRFYFWAFFFIVFLIFSAIYRRKLLRNAFLLLVSLFFYYKSSGLFFSILIITTATDYFLGLGIHASRKKSWKLFLFLLSLALNLSFLVYFKYAYFFTENFNQVFGTEYGVFNHLSYAWNELTGSHFTVDKILLPAGISFFTFQTISYCADVYRGKLGPVRNILDFGFFVAFFPQLVAGPIVRASEFIPQVFRDTQVTKQDFGIATFWILKGLVKKLIIADYIAVNFVDRVFADPLMFDGMGNILGIAGYSLQVYADFAGYTDIAIGIALLMGFTLPVNFNAPYKAKNVGEFWKRWHISLSTWLRDYLYIPLGGSKGASFPTHAFIPVCGSIAAWYFGEKYSRETGYTILAGTAVLSLVYLLFARFAPGKIAGWMTSFNLLITMLLGGFWHGPSWQFVIWGGLNGLGLVVYKYWRKISPWENSNLWIVNAWRILLTFTFISFTRIWFRSKSLDIADQVLNQIAYHIDLTVFSALFTGYWNVFVIMLFGFVIHWLPEKTKDALRDTWVAIPLGYKIPLAAATVFVCYQFVSADLQPFIYFQF